MPIKRVFKKAKSSLILETYQLLKQLRIYRPIILKMKLFLLLIFYSISSIADRVPPVCKMGSYVYTGVYHSSTYSMTKDKGSRACLERRDFDEEKIKKEYNENLSKIEGLMDFMLNEPRCISTKDTLEEYRRNLKKHKADYKEGTEFAIGFLKNYIKHIDIQRQFAYIAAYSATCNGGHDRKTSFIDLDTINKITFEAAPVKVTKDGQNIDTCFDVQAYGSEDLNSFVISLKYAKGDDFLFSYDPYGIPDQLIMKDSGGAVLFDSTCTSTRPEQKNVKIPLAKLSNDKRISINIVNNCSSPGRAPGESSWEFQLKCQGEAIDPCHKEKTEFIKLVKNKIEQTKTILDAISRQRECFAYMDEYILADLEEDGLIEPGDVPLTNGMCETMDEECHQRQEKHRQSEWAPKPTRTTSSLPEPVPAVKEKRICNSKPLLKESILEHISHAYCTIGQEKLGLE